MRNGVFLRVRPGSDCSVGFFLVVGGMLQAV